MATATQAPLKPPPTPPTPPDYGKPPDPPPVDRAVIEVGQLFTVLAQDPKLRPKVLGIMREAAPHIPIPELDVQQRTEESVKAATTPLQEENTKLRERLDKLEGSLSKREWQERNGVDDEEMTELATFAKDKKLGDPDVALDYYRKSDLGRPRGTIASTMTEESRKDLYKNPKEWAMREGNRILSDLRRRGRG